MELHIGSEHKLWSLHSRSLLGTIVSSGYHCVFMKSGVSYQPRDFAALYAHCLHRGFLLLPGLCTFPQCINKVNFILSWYQANLKLKELYCHYGLRGQNGGFVLSTPRPWAKLTSVPNVFLGGWWEETRAAGGNPYKRDSTCSRWCFCTC